jgi:probable O-glycosylation ligase (exosortase A-associated)
VIMTLPLILVVARASWERRVGIPLIERFPRIFGAGLYSMFGLSVVATIFTQSRGALVGLLATTPLIVLKMRYRVPIILAGVLLSGVIVAAFPAHLLDRWETILHYQQDASAMQRLQAWGVNWNMAVERPLVGAGFFNYMIGDARWLSYANWVEPWANSPRAAHSIFFQVLGNQGFLGAALYFALILFTVHTLFRVRARARATSELSWAEDIAWALLVGIVGFFAAGAFLDMAYFHLIFLYIALAIILRREVEEARVLNVSAPVIEPTRHGRNVPKIAFPDFVARRD